MTPYLIQMVPITNLKYVCKMSANCLQQEMAVEEPTEELNLEMIEPSKINQFKYVIDRYM